MSYLWVIYNSQVLHEVSQLVLPIDSKKTHFVVIQKLVVLLALKSPILRDVSVCPRGQSCSALQNFSWRPCMSITSLSVLLCNNVMLGAIHRGKRLCCCSEIHGPLLGSPVTDRCTSWIPSHRPCWHVCLSTTVFYSFESEVKGISYWSLWSEAAICLESRITTRNRLI
jgi:hypothetical protein